MGLDTAYTANTMLPLRFGIASCSVTALDAVTGTHSPAVMTGQFAFLRAVCIPTATVYKCCVCKADRPSFEDTKYWIYMLCCVRMPAEFVDLASTACQKLHRADSEWLAA